MNILTPIARRRSAQRLVRVQLQVPSIYTRRKLHLAPPFLLDDYTPRYTTLSSVDTAKKRSAAYAHLRNCNLCPRLCGVNRYETTGMCLIGEKAKVNVVAPHFGEGMCCRLYPYAHRTLFGPLTERFSRTLRPRPQWFRCCVLQVCINTLNPLRWKPLTRSLLLCVQ